MYGIFFVNVSGLRVYPFVFNLEFFMDCSSPSVLIYDKKNEMWSSDTSPTPPGLVAEAVVAWTGAEMLAWSGACGNSAPVSIGGRYQPPAYIP